MKRYYFNHSKNYIDSYELLSKEQIQLLTEIMSFFPHKNKENWPEILNSFQSGKYPPKLVNMAANALDHHGWTMLGIACEYGRDTGVVQKLIDMGANLDKPDHCMKKLPLHHAINNQLSRSNRDSVEAVAVLQCLLKNGVNTQNTCFQNKTALSFAQSQNFKAAVKLVREHMRCSRDYGVFQKTLHSGNTHALTQMLRGSTLLSAWLPTLKGWSPVFNLIHKSYGHPNSLKNLILLKKHHIDFNTTLYVKTYSGIPVYCSLNPIAYLLLRGGDSRLIGALIKHGVDPKHPSIAVVKKIIELHPHHKTLDYPVKNEDNPYDVNSRTMLEIFEAEMSQAHEMTSKTRKRFHANSMHAHRIFQLKVNEPSDDMIISNEEMLDSAFGKGSFTAKL